MSVFRLNKLSEQIRDEISLLISSGKVKDPRVSTFLSINRIEVSRDLAYAKIYVSSFMDAHKTKQGVRGLENASGFIRTTLSKKLHIRQCPRLTFIYDESLQEGFDMVKKLDALQIQPEADDDADI